MSRQNLTATKGGINRLRTKGSPSPDTLFDGLNCYVDEDGTPQSRPGTVIDFILPSERCKGLLAYEDALITFSNQVEVGVPAGISAVVIAHPTDQSLELKEVHFAASFMGFPYVVAEFVNGDVFHYWLEEAAAWEADKIYMIGDLVSPTTPNGLAYRALRNSEPNPAWAPDVARAVDDVVEPTEYNGYKYTVIETIGLSPRSGDTEPAWPAQDGAIISEDTDGGGDTTPTEPSQPVPAQTLPPRVADRYQNQSGNQPDNSEAM